jgi:hypothetical protein
MRRTINVKSPKNISKWQMGFNSAFKGLTVAMIDQNKPHPSFTADHRLVITEIHREISRYSLSIPAASFLVSRLFVFSLVLHFLSFRLTLLLLLFLQFPR